MNSYRPKRIGACFGELLVETDWPLLQEQKMELVRTIGDELDHPLQGLVHFLDALGDKGLELGLWVDTTTYEET